MTISRIFAGKAKRSERERDKGESVVGVASVEEGCCLRMATRRSPRLHSSTDQLLASGSAHLRSSISPSARQHSSALGRGAATRGPLDDAVRPAGEPKRSPSLRQRFSPAILKTPPFPPETIQPAGEPRRSPSPRRRFSPAILPPTPPPSEAVASEGALLLVRQNCKSQGTASATGAPPSPLVFSVWNPPDQRLDLRPLPAGTIAALSLAVRQKSGQICLTLGCANCNTACWQTPASERKKSSIFMCQLKRKK